MHYIIQENIFKENNYNIIIETLDKLNLSYQIVRIFPFIDKMVDINDIPEDNDFNVDELPELELNNNQKIFVFGSVKMARVSAKKNWYPGSFMNENHDFEVYSKYYRDNLLNYDSEILKVSDRINWDIELKFIRPTKDSKAFTGKVFSKDEWDLFLENNLENVKIVYQELVDRYWEIEKYL